jgi:hypothetical protein
MTLAEAAIHAERAPLVEGASLLDLRRGEGRNRRRSRGTRIPKWTKGKLTTQQPSVLLTEMRPKGPEGHPEPKPGFDAGT